MRTLILAALAACWSAVVAAQTLLPAGPGDQVPSRLVHVPAPPVPMERQPLSLSWALDPAATLAAPAPHAAVSREYWRPVEAEELRGGVDLHTTAPGAVVRLSPAAGAAKLWPAGLDVRAPDGTAVRLEQAAGEAELQAAGMPVDAGTSIVRLDRRRGAGRYTLRAANAAGRYVLHVFEPASDVVLHARPRRDHLLGGERVDVDIAMTRRQRRLTAHAEALLVAPDGSSRPVPVRAGSDGALVADVAVPLVASPVPGLWELQVFASGDGIPRDARTAFAVAAPTARLADGTAFDATRLQLALPIEAASAGRYEARATLYATGPDRMARPVVQAHAAAWFAPGTGTLVLAFDRRHLPPGHGAPFEVRHLELHDQSRLAPLETRAFALRR